MHRLWDFVQHNNAVPIGLFILFGTTGAAFAANPDVVYEEIESVQSVDNTYIVEVDLENRDFDLEITDITEDDENYYISYGYNTISIVDYVWREVEVSKHVTYSKKELTGRDLGLFLAEQLGEELTAEIAYLTEVQKKEREAGATHKKVATEYRGLVGRMFDPTEKEFDGYKPVVKEEDTVSSGATAAAILAGAGETHDALPDFEAFVAQAVANALAAQTASSTSLGIATSTASTTASTTDQTSDNNNDDTNDPPADDTPIDTSTSTPPIDTGTSTPPVEEEPADDTASSTPPVEEEPAPEPEPETSPEPETTPAEEPVVEETPAP